MEYTIKLSEQQLNLWGQALIDMKLTHAESLVRAELLHSISMQTKEQQKSTEAGISPVPSPRTNGTHPSKES